MKNELLDGVRRVRDEIAKECGHDVKRLAALVRSEELRCAGKLLAATAPSRPRPRRGRRTKVA